jgi:hypothetical protein
MRYQEIQAMTEPSSESDDSETGGPAAPRTPTGSTGSTDAEEDGTMAAKIGTIAGVLVFVGGGLATVLTAITNFGADGGALDAARRNHTGLLVAAAALAAGGLFLGATYTILMKALKDSRPATIVAPYTLMAGVAAIVAGVVMGVAATVNREPGRPSIALERLNKDSIKVTVTADGLASSASYDARIEGYHQTPAPDGRKPTQVFIESLVLARFSPAQDGDLEWERVVDISPPTTTLPINYVQVIVAKENVEGPTCGAMGNDAPTCLYTRIPPETPDSGPAPGGRTP